MADFKPIKSLITAILLTGLAVAASGCILAAGAALGGAGYELHQAKEMRELDQELAEGRVTRQEYLARKRQIEESSLLQ